MKAVGIGLIVLLVSPLVLGDKSADLKCLVCKRTVEEIEVAIQKVDPKKTIDVGTFRLDSKGNQKQTSVQYARSEIHLMEILENVCEHFTDYTQATYKSSGQLTLLRLIGHDGKMNPEMSDVDIVQDLDTNNKLKFYCEGFVEDHEDAILEIFSTSQENSDVLLCTKSVGLCNDEVGDDYNFEDHEEL